MTRRKNPVTYLFTGSDEDSGVTHKARFERADDGEVRLIELIFTATPGRGITAATLRRFPLSIALGSATRAVHDQEPEKVHVQLPAVTRPDGTNRWYQRFAAVFLVAKERSSSPAALIAEQSGVPVSAVHRWTREARRRGFLPPDPRARRIE